MPIKPFFRLLRIPTNTALLAAALCFAAPAPAQAQLQEHVAKAAFVFNFAVFTEWPDGALGDALTVCVNMESPMRPAIEEFHGKPVKGRRMAVRSLHNIDNTRGCQILLLDQLDRERWATARKAIGNDSVLTITDDPDIAREGAMIFIGLAGGKLLFDIDTNITRQSRLTLSSKLLRLARTVK